MSTSGGQTIEFVKAGVTCVVGANNVGKSRFLRELNAFLEEGSTTPATFSGLNLAKPALTEDAATAFLEHVGAKSPLREGYGQEYMPSSGGGQAVNYQTFLLMYNARPNSLQQVKPFFATYASAGSLVGAASGSAGSVGLNGPAQPMLRVFRDGQLEEELSSLASESFGESLTLDRLSGDIRLRVGAVDLPVPPINRPTKEYSDAVAGLPTLEEQGDGLKSFLGLCFILMVGTAQILLVDEPEAFLHPSQARALGRWLGREAVKRDVQVVLSTHDRDLLLGLLDAEGEPAVNVVRLTRDGTVNHAKSLPPEKISATWKDPVLRYSNVMQGLFHRAVAITESDADCRFYGAVLDVVGAEAHLRAAADGVLFVPSGGKQRVASMAKALTTLGVETFAIVDFDVLRTRADISGIVEAIGAAWTDDMNTAYITIAQAANNASLWDLLKHHGVGGLPPGPVHQAGTELITMLKQVGVLVVPVGEMEDFDKSIGAHGAGWVTEMLSRGAHQTCSSAKTFLASLLGTTVVA